MTPKHWFIGRKHQAVGVACGLSTWRCSRKRFALANQEESSNSAVIFYCLGKLSQEAKDQFVKKKEKVKANSKYNVVVAAVVVEVAQTTNDVNWTRLRLNWSKQELLSSSIRKFLKNFKHVGNKPRR